MSPSSIEDGVVFLFLSFILGVIFKRRRVKSSSMRPGFLAPCLEGPTLLECSAAATAAAILKVILIFEQESHISILPQALQIV